MTKHRSPRSDLPSLDQERNPVPPGHPPCTAPATFGLVGIICRQNMKHRRTEEALRAFEGSPNTIQSIPLKRAIEGEKR